MTQAIYRCGRIALLAGLMMASLPTVAAAAADGYSVAATAVDSTGVAEGFVTWRVFALPDSTRMIVGAVTGEDGAIRAELAAPGRFLLRLAGPSGGESAAVEFELTDDAPAADLGNIALHPVNAALREVEVVAARPVVTREIDRMVYDVNSDEEARTAPLIDILRKVPLVSVDAEGNISVNGSNSFKIYKNGRPNNTYTNNAKDIFKSLPASAIKKIEVITEPGAREDAEGSAMILNIVTNSNTVVKGVNGSAGITLSTDGYVPAPNLWLTTQLDKVTVSVNGNLNYTPRNTITSDHEQHAHYATTGNTANSAFSASSSQLYGMGGLELSWEPDTLNLFTLAFDTFHSRSKSLLTSSNDMTDPDGITLYSYATEQQNDPSRYGYVGLNANYQRSTRRKGETITASYLFYSTDLNSNSSTLYIDGVNMPIPYSGMHNDSKQSLNEHTVQLDWSRPYGDKLKLDLGSKYIRRINHSKTRLAYDDAPQMDSYSDYVHTTDVVAAYADGRLALRGFSLRAGLRYEYAHMASDYRTASGTDFGVSLNDLVPNVALAWNATPASTLKLSYSRRISRPWMTVLDPAVVETLNRTFAGNPDLHSQGFNQMNINFNMIKPKVMLDATVNYSFSNDGIAQTVRVEGDHAYFSYANCARNRSLTANLWSQWTPSPKTRLSLYMYWQLSSIEYPDDGVKLTRPRYYTSLSLNQQLPWKLSLTAYGGWQSGAMQGIYNYFKFNGLSAFNHGLTLQRDFLKEGRLSVALSVRNPLFSHMKSTLYTVNSDYTGWQKNESHPQRSAMIRISYRFGSLRAAVKKTAATINNDDRGGDSSSAR